jgi:hypothetical protein
MNLKRAVMALISKMLAIRLRQARAYLQLSGRIRRRNGFELTESSGMTFPHHLHRQPPIYILGETIATRSTVSIYSLPGSFSTLSQGRFPLLWMDGRCAVLCCAVLCRPRDRQRLGGSEAVSGWEGVFTLEAIAAGKEQRCAIYTGEGTASNRQDAVVWTVDSRRAAVLAGTESVGGKEQSSCDVARKGKGWHLADLVCAQTFVDSNECNKRSTSTGTTTRTDASKLCGEEQSVSYIISTLPTQRRARISMFQRAA